MRVALDITSLDGYALQHGLFRYAVDLIHGLHALGAVGAGGAEFVVVGSKPFPVPELQHIFDPVNTRWQYACLPKMSGHGAYWIEHVRYFPLMRRLRVDVLHSLHGFVPALHGCRLVFTVHDLMPELFPEYAARVESRPYRITQWLAKHRATRLIAISESTANDLRERWNIPDSKIDVVPHGLSPSFSSIAVRTSDLPSKPMDQWFRILSPYNLEPRKNLATLLRAVSLIRNEIEFKLILFGRAACTVDREREVDKLIDSLGIRDCVVKTGYVDDATLASYYQKCDLFVFPSLYEGFGYPLLEAMAFGACVIGRNASAMAEVVGDGGVLVETGDANEIASAMLALARDSNRRRTLSLLAKQRAATFTVHEMARKTFQSYCRAASTSPDALRAPVAADSQLRQSHSTKGAASAANLLDGK
ncbi:MAG: glycosyltransferase family 4 protein [Anaerolineae bacterium]|nr:glycosyltransferase family 4 protein [Phycisphaerae bacterium]